MESSPQPDLILTHEAKVHLESTRKWTLFISIVGMVFMALLVIFGFTMSAMFSKMSGMEGMPNFPSGALGFIYLIFAVIYFFPLLYLLRFSTNTKKAIRDNDPGALTAAFKNLDSHYTFLGVIMAIILGLYAMIAIIGGSVAAFS